MQFVEVELDPGESAIAEAGAMMYMTPGIEMGTVFGDGRAEDTGVLEKILGAGKRVLTGESLFHHRLHERLRREAAGRLRRPLRRQDPPDGPAQLGGTLICQKGLVLVRRQRCVDRDRLPEEVRVGLFGGEGFIMQKLEGDGLCFVHAGGTVHPLDLRPGETLRVDTGCIVALQPP